MNKEIEERLKALENMPLSKLEHRHYLRVVVSYRFLRTIVLRSFFSVS